MEITEGQRVIMEEFSHLAGAVRSLIEALTEDPPRRKSWTNLFEKEIYKTRNVLLERLTNIKIDS